MADDRITNESKATHHPKTTDQYLMEKGLSLINLASISGPEQDHPRPYQLYSPGARSNKVVLMATPAPPVLPTTDQHFQALSTTIQHLSAKINPDRITIIAYGDRNKDNSPGSVSEDGPVSRRLLGFVD
jgi:hypothetical protein